jgi:hypothetical protein
MPTLDEVMGAKTSFAADAATGVQVLSDMGNVVFDLYHRTVLPLDGYVFWVQDADAETSITVSGSLHYDTDFRQDESNNYAASRCVFTSLTEVNDLRDVGPNECYIATQGNLVFAFSSRGYFYKKVDLYHYRGFATYNDVLTQVVPAGTNLHADEVIVSNSLPIWLSFNSYVAGYGFTTSGVASYPSFLVPDNEEPPYAAVHILPETTQALGGAPRLTTAPAALVLTSLAWAGGIVTATTAAPHGITTPAALITIAGAVPAGYNGTVAAKITGASTFTYPLAANPGAETAPGTYKAAGTTAGTSHDQLVQERVRVTLTGLNNEQALNFIDFVNQFTLDNPGVLGVMNQPVPRDEKRTQNELRVIGQKKTIEFQVNYYQSAVFDIAQRLIETVNISFTPQ